MYKITIEKLAEYEETTSAYRDPENPEKIYFSKYDAEEPIRERLQSHQRPTGKKLLDSKKIFEQVVDDMEMESVIRAVNGMGL